MSLDLSVFLDMNGMFLHEKRVPPQVFKPDMNIFDVRSKTGLLQNSDFCQFTYQTDEKRKVET